MRKASLILITLFFTIFYGKSYAQEPGLINLGFSAGGTGLAGIPVQIRPVKFLAIDFGLYGRIAQSNVHDFEPDWYFGPAFDFGFSVYLIKSDNSEKNRSALNGIYFKGALGLKDLQEKTLSLGWTGEIYSEKYPKGFIQFQIGPSVRFQTEKYINPRYPPGYQEQTLDIPLSAMVYARLCWFFKVI